MTTELSNDVTGAPPVRSSAWLGVTVGFRTIVADPPWKYGAWGRAPLTCRPATEAYPADKIYPMAYDTMSVDEIATMPVRELAADDCDLYLWTTQKYLPESFRVVEAWGFRYCGTLAWCKTPRGTGQGGLYCPTTEFLVHGRKGKMPQGKKRQDSTWWNVKRPHNSHSTKPEFFQDVVELVSDAPRLEMFARRRRLGWSAFGNECNADVTLVTPNMVICDNSDTH